MGPLLRGLTVTRFGDVQLVDDKEIEDEDRERVELRSMEGEEDREEVKYLFIAQHKAKKHCVKRRKSVHLVCSLS